MGDRMQQGSPRRARVAVVTLAFPGYSLGEEKAPAKREEALALLGRANLDLVPCEGVVTDRDGARQAGAWLARQGVDAVCAILATFVPDHYLVDLTSGSDLPLFLWSVEREMGCISLVGAMLANPTLYGLGKHYQLFAGDLADSRITAKLQVFARAAAMRTALRAMRVGYMGENPDIMFSMAVDELGLTKTFGVTVIPIRDFEYTLRSERVPEEKAREDWRGVTRQVGRVEVQEADGVKASRGYLAMETLAREMKLDALSINCWTHLKSCVCLPVARLNDQGIGAGCEGDLHSTILMRLLYEVTGRSTINGDFLRMFPENNQIMFSHCGAGPFSMARSAPDIVLHASEETGDGIGVFYPADQPGAVTAVNLMGSREGYRLTALCGDVETTDMAYEGNPMRVRFRTPVNDILQSVVDAGAGHHWTIAYGDFSEELRLLCRFLSVRYTLVR
jgi:L-fucose isomerase-like protein